MTPIEDFKPDFLFRNHHIQTIISPLVRKPTPLPTSKVWKHINDDVYLYGKLNPTKENHNHIIAIFHGLGGHINSPYVTGVASSLINKGFSTLRMSLRGGEDDSIHTYHANQIEDIGWVVSQLKSEGYKVSLLGFSLSSTMILKWLEQKRDIESAFIISPATNLDRCVKRLDDPGNKMYQHYFIKKLRTLLEMKAKKFPHVFEQYLKPETFSSIRGFDSNFTAPRNGFSSAEEYYFESSPHQLEKIQNRICIVHAKDDPFIDHQDLEKLKSLNLPNIDVNLTNYGGHVGFYQGIGKPYQIDVWAGDYFCKTLLAKSSESDK